MAPDYEAYVASVLKKRVEKVIVILEQEGLLRPDTEILDVGCGPGTYALPFARQVKAVTALDAARVACRILEQKVRKEQLTNITVLERLWEDVDLAGEGLAGRFDLAFASLTPAVRDYETLIKLNQASRGYCCLVSRVGSCDPVRQDLWRAILKQEQPKPDHNLVYIFNLLFTKGYCPTMRYFNVEWVEDQAVNGAAKMLCRHFWKYTEITPEVKEQILFYVQQHSVGGRLRFAVRTCFNVMTWRTDSQFG